MNSLERIYAATTNLAKRLFPVPYKGEMSELLEVATAEIDRLRAELKSSARFVHIGHAVERASGELPYGFDLHIELEKDAGIVRLYLPDTDALLDDFEADDFAGQINSAIDAAVGYAQQSRTETALSALAPPEGRSTHVAGAQDAIPAWASEQKDTAWLP